MYDFPVPHTELLMLLFVCVGVLLNKLTNPIHLQLYEEGSGNRTSTVLQAATDEVHKYSRSSFSESFTAKRVLIVTWERVRPKAVPVDAAGASTFQVSLRLQAACCTLERCEDSSVG